MTIRTALLTSVNVRAFVFETTFGKGYVPTASDVAAAKQAQANGNNSAGDPMLARGPDSGAMLEYWDLTDAIVDGIVALRLGGDTYLPRFSEEENSDYQYRLKCTKLTNIYRDTIEALASKPFSQEVAISKDGTNSIPSAINDFNNDVDGSGNNITSFAAMTFFNGINSAIDWIFVDSPKADPSIRTQADAKQAGIRPYWSHVLGRNILDVRSAIINGSETLIYIKIYEPGAPERVREFIRDDTGNVTWQLYEKQLEQVPNSQTQFVLIDEGVVTIGIIPLVPFMTGRRDGRCWKFFPAMRDAADLQIELYQQESALKFAKTLAAYPMLAGNGVNPMMNTDNITIKKLAVGPGKVLYAPPNGNGVAGSWAYVEPAATSLTFLAADVKETIQQLRELGRQPLTAQSGNLTVITTMVAADKAKSAVVAWAYGLKNALENSLKITAQWLGITDYEPTVFVYTDFDEFMAGKDLDSLDIMRGAKDLSQLTYWEEMQRRHVLSADFTPERETKRLLAELPSDGPDTVDPADPNSVPNPLFNPNDLPVNKTKPPLGETLPPRMARP